MDQSVEIKVTVRTNSGENKAVPASDIDDAMSIAKKFRTQDSYMVCIVQDEVRMMRWDRETVVGENQWYQEDPGAFELLGAVRSIRVVRPLHPLGLRCYQVGEADWFAATSPEHALELMYELEGEEEMAEYEIVLSNDATLDEGWCNADEPAKCVGTLREWLAAATEPGWLAGTGEHASPAEEIPL
ncbi:hypothetical protein ACI77O_13440 [Pseudomonas tritici]|uniref:type IV pilus biogenesis protein PilI n=1 Tax=Pseudomonas tritici TaxID=2745518 RepID=UPI00387ABCAF